MKYILSTLILLGIVVSTLFSPTLISASDFNSSTGGVNCSGSAGQSSVCQDLAKEGNPLYGQDGIITRVARIFGLITGVISVFMIVIAGTRYVNSGGDPSKTASAKNTIIYALVGVVVAGLAGGIAQFVLSSL
jgi:hypothetical protein